MFFGGLPKRLLIPIESNYPRINFIITIITPIIIVLTTTIDDSIRPLILADSVAETLRVVRSSKLTLIESILPASSDAALASLHGVAWKQGETHWPKLPRRRVISKLYWQVFLHAFRSRWTFLQCSRSKYTWPRGRSRLLKRFFFFFNKMSGKLYFIMSAISHWNCKKNRKFEIGREKSIFVV